MDSETLADIAREMREYDNTPPPKRAWMDLADRIEAASEREKVEAVTIAATKAVNLTDEKWRRDAGNAAALREALELCVREMCAYCRAEAAMTMPGKECFYGCEALRVAKSALAAPPRNCDRYRTEKEAEAAFDRFCAKARDGECKPWECPLKSTGGKYCYVAWLLATAEEGGEK